MSLTDTREQRASSRLPQFGQVGERRRLLPVVIVVAIVNLLVIGAFLVTNGSDDGGSGAAAPVDVPDLMTAGSDRWVVDLDESGLALRARVGDCAIGSGTVEQSTDGGASWAPVPGLALAAVYGVSAGGAGPPMIIGATDECELRQWRSDDGGRSWSEVEEGPGMWYRDPASPTTVISPGGAGSSPCGDQTVSVDVRTTSDGSALVSCRDGVLYRSFDDGGRWEETGRIPDLVGATYVGTVGYALAADPDCQGAQVLRNDEGPWSPLACVPNADPTDASVVVLGETGVLAAYNGTWRTSDGGTTWTLLRS